MRILSFNHLRLGSSPGGIPEHATTDSPSLSTRFAWQRAVRLAIRERVHAVLLSGHTLSATNTGLEPWGPLVDGLAELQQADIPVIAIEHGEFNPANLARFAPENAVHWLDDTLEWEPIFSTSLESRDVPTVHIVAGSLAEHVDSPVESPVTLAQIDHPDSIWLLTDPLQPDQIAGEHALVLEPGSLAPLSPRETGRHGAWLIDTETREAKLLSLAVVEFAAVDIAVDEADDLDNLERIISSRLVELADSARQDGSIAEFMLVDVTLSGSTPLFPMLAETTAELERMLRIEHDGMSIAITRITNDATPPIDLEPLLNRPDPVGEIARIIHSLDTGEELSESHSRLVTQTEQKLLAISHSRVFGPILDTEPETDAPTLLRRQGWATLDALVRQRGIDS